MKEFGFNACWLTNLRSLFRHRGKNLTSLLVEMRRILSPQILCQATVWSTIAYFPNLTFVLLFEFFTVCAFSNHAQLYILNQFCSFPKIIFSTYRYTRTIGNNFNCMKICLQDQNFTVTSSRNFKTTLSTTRFCFASHDGTYPIVYPCQYHCHDISKTI